jgi:MOSC domain-containing protein YiiM
MQVLSVNVGKVRETKWKGKTFNTAIFKEPVTGRVPVGTLGLADDEHANTENHGGVLKALFPYPYEHYAEFWHEALSGTSLSHGRFGENLTTQSWLDDQINLGDRYRIGTATVMVTIPRKPPVLTVWQVGTDFLIESIDAQHGC